MGYSGISGKLIFMRKINLIILFISIANILCGQVFISENGEVSFYSYAPIEDITAISKQVNGIVNTVTGEVAFMIPMRSFKFEKALMEEHFNDKYIESEKYPQATFKGSINEKIDYSKNGNHNISAKGKLTIHGKEKEVNQNATLEVQTDKLILQTEFLVALKDYDISIPQILFNNIADTVSVKLKATYVPFKKK
jgi:hypothetical protein